MQENIKRCRWVTDDKLYRDYHDNEWGVPCYDAIKLFEMLCLEGAQAGLSWITVLKKRADYRILFDQFEPHKMAAYTEEKIQSLMQDSRIIRNKLKINAFISNARAYLELEQTQNFKDFMWQFVEHKPINNHYSHHEDIPVSTAQSEAMSQALKKHGFKFVGPTICYAFMQAVGMVNDHTKDCFKYQEVNKG